MIEMLILTQYTALLKMFQFFFFFTVEAWNLIYKGVYNAHGINNGGGSYGRVPVTRPYVTDKLPQLMWYDPKDLFEGWHILVNAAKSIPMTDPLR